VQRFDRPLVHWLLVAALAQLSVRAVAGGVALVVAPSGALVGLSTGTLDGTPFADFLVPGAVLAVVFGLTPAVACYALHRGRWWGWLAAIGLAVALVVWVLVEVAVGFARPTVYLNVGTAVAVLVLAVHPAVRRDETDAVGS
jgi:uncharacterized membrane protein (UPF0136 family)